jgi:hypothetical protein
MGVVVLGTLAMLEGAAIAFSWALHGVFLGWPISKFGAVAEIAAIAAIVLFLTSAAGLLGLEPWGRNLARIAATLYLVVTFGEVWIGARGFTRFGAVFFYVDNLLAVGISGWAIWYLSQSAVRSAFENSWSRLRQ